MQCPPSVMWATLVLLPLLTASTPAAQAPSTAPATTRAATLAELRHAFQGQELITAKPFSYVFSKGQTPRVIWRDVEEVRRLGCADPSLRVRWFDAHLREAPEPDAPGRWGAYIEGTAPNGTPLRRAATFYCRPEGFLFLFPQGRSGPLPHVPGLIGEGVWREHQVEVDRLRDELLFRGLNDSEAGAVLVAGLSEMKPLGWPPTSLESARVRDEDFHLALKLKVLGLQDKVRPVAPPRTQPEGAKVAPALYEGTPAEAGVSPDAKQRIDAVCRAWAADTDEPFVTLVARRGVIVTHEPFGRDKDGNPIGRDYRSDVFSITKTVTAILFSQFVDQGLLDLDDPVSRAFSDWPAADPHVPTFRQCFTHTSGLTGHGDFGGVRNAHLDNVILNGLDANEPGKTYAYSGMGFDLAVEAMELVTGKSALRLYADHLFAPLGLGDVPMDLASSGAQPTAYQLGVLAQWLANRGSYGGKEFVSPATFDRLLPEALGKRYPGITEVEGIGMHWMNHPRPGAPKGSKAPEHLFFSPRTIGHGSLSSSIFLADLDRDLVIVQLRRTAGERFGEWSQTFYEAIDDSLR